MVLRVALRTQPLRLIPPRPIPIHILIRSIPIPIPVRVSMRIRIPTRMRPRALVRAMRAQWPSRPSRSRWRRIQARSRDVLRSPIVRIRR